jgi:dihydroxy-acid dehydratase
MHDNERVVMTDKINKYSSRITKPKSQGASQAMLYGIGMSDADMQKAQVGISSVWYEGNTCNMHLNDLAARVKVGVEAAGLVGLRFNTIGVSDGISMGTEGMSYSLPSRDLIADSIETVMRAQWYDANISLPGCDKNMPGCLIAMARVNRPALMVYGGTIRAGELDGVKLDIVSAFQSYGEYMAGTIDEQQRQAIVKKSCPGAGACGGMYTANTMASAIEAMGMSLPFSASRPAESDHKRDECRRAGEAILRLLQADIKPRDIMTREAFENALVVLTVLGGSTNAVLHLIAMARAVDVPLSIDDFQRVSDRVPLLADMKPSGTYVQEDLDRIGGIPALMKVLLDEGLLDGRCLTVTGRTLAENLADVDGFKPGQRIVRHWKIPSTPPVTYRSCGATWPRTVRWPRSPERKVSPFSGRANVFDAEEDMLTALEAGRILKGDVVVIRYEGPKGGPGMPEMLTPTSAIMGAGLGKDVALITDGRFSGGSHGFIVGHITPEAQEGGPIALVRTGDTITIDTATHTIDVQVDPAEMTRRRKAWTAPPYKVSRGILYKYIRTVRSASEGCVTDA